MNILLLEDSIETVEKLRFSLTHFDQVTLDQINTVDEIGKRVNLHDYELILCNFNLIHPHQGEHLFDALNKSRSGATLPLIVYTQQELSSTEIIQLFRSGVSDVLLNNNFFELKSVIERCRSKQKNTAVFNTKENRFSTTVNSLVEHIAVVDARGNIIEANDSWLQFGKKYGDRDLIRFNKVGGNILTRLTEASSANAQAKHVLRGFKRVVEEHRKFFTDFKVELEDETRWYLLRLTPSLEGSNFILSFSNISLRKRIEKLLAESEERFREILNNSSEITMVLSKSGEIDFVSPAVKSLLGYSVGDLLNRNALSFIHPYYKKRALRGFKKCLAYNSQIGYEIYMVNKSNKEKAYLRVSLSNHIGTDGVNGVIVNAQDVSEFMKSESNWYLSILKAEEAERKRIANDLHDGLGQVIAAANIAVSGLERMIADQLDERAMAYYKIGRDLIAKATRETRMISHHIAPQSLITFGLDESVRSLLNSYQEINPDIKFEFHTNLKKIRFPREVELTCFRVIQEALNNAVKYSKSALIIVKVETAGKELCAEIIDQGIGFDYKEVKLKPNSGSGLRSMSQRIKEFSGKLIISSIPQQGTEVSVKFDLEKPNFNLDEYLDID